MKKRSWLLFLAPAVCFAGVAVAQQYPLLDMAANKVVQKYQGSSCEQLAQERAAKLSAAKSPQEERMVGFLRQNPQARAEFFQRVSAPVVTKMFECGMIP